jgi:hypothetical protein
MAWAESYPGRHGVDIDRDKRYTLTVLFGGNCEYSDKPEEKFAKHVM